MSDLGYFDYYGDLIIAVIIICWLSLYTYLSKEYGPIDE